jgi:aminoglycoside phosphotransferase (APT) family kinase protein
VTDPETIEVRADETLPLDRVEPWLRAHLPDATGPLSVRQFGGGHANLTYLLAFDGREYVLRRPPLGPVAPSAHDMRREHQVLARLWRGYPLAPRSYALCTDPAVLGVDFHVLERRRGFVVRMGNAGLVTGDPALAARIGAMLIDSLAALHGVDPAAVGLADLGRPEGYLARQVEGWTKRWHAALDDSAPDAADLVAWIARERPPDSAPALVHNDFKLDNILVAEDDPARPVAVLDWDMCTRGDPLTDLGTLLTYWVEAGDPPLWREAAMMPSYAEGFPTRAEAVARYAEVSGRDLARIGWYEVFGAFKTAVILQQIYIRYLRGQTKDARFANFGARVRALVEKGRRVAGR